MNAATRPELSARQRQTLATAERDADSGRRIRAEAVRRWHDGESRSDVAARANVSPTTVRRWVNEFEETGTVPAGTRRQPQPSTVHAPRGNVVAVSTGQFLTVLGPRLHEARRLRGWSKAQLLAVSGVGYSPAVLGHWERGSRAMPIIAFAILCRALAIDSGEVIRRCYDESFAHVRGLPR